MCLWIFEPMSRPEHGCAHQSSEYRVQTLPCCLGLRWGGTCGICTRLIITGSWALARAPMNLCYMHAIMLHTRGMVKDHHREDHGTFASSPSHVFSFGSWELVPFRHDITLGHSYRRIHIEPCYTFYVVEQYLANLDRRNILNDHQYGNLF